MTVEGLQDWTKFRVKGKINKGSTPASVLVSTLVIAATANDAVEACQKEYAYLNIPNWTAHAVGGYNNERVVHLV